ncbi:transglutaminase-like domain-containing protein [Salinibacterium soli]|uniref:Transglutaminase family protein n=1 Tax=Antiquaquibacter soli TaxID=3064523 RepID=A0ABT9BM32_9MICO|nr:transglutaminase family protein [Protaetiibacter sp. WY-16]MDO7881497.1 transglutaminase family protein [Protaetiibacter sp. WY-16]
MKRTVSARLELDLAGTTNLVLEAAVAESANRVAESLSIVRDGIAVAPEELVDMHGTRLHRFTSDAGRMTIEYSADVEGRSEPAPVLDLDLVTYLRPSRYCESDSLTPTARAEFSGLSGHELVAAVTQWVADRLSYVPGASLPTDGAEQTLLARRGVCRDYAHLVIALLRALDVPARMVAVYAPGLDPMDFHAVAEAFVDGEWWVVDATRLAPRQSLLRISTGRDAADTAFLTNHGSDLRLQRLEVLAIVDELPFDDGIEPIRLG